MRWVTGRSRGDCGRANHHILQLESVDCDGQVNVFGLIAGYRSRDEARQDVFDYVEMFYNPKRKHVRNGIPSPVEFEKQQKR